MPKNIPSPSLPDKGRKRIMRIIIEDPVLSLTDISFLEKGILALAHSFTKNGSRLYLSDEDLAVPFSTHRMTVNRAVQNLVKLGYLEKRTEARTGGKSYRSLGSLVDEHSNKMHLCLDEVNESIATNCISHSNKMHLCSPSIATNCISHSNKLHHIIKSNLKDINLKEVKEIVADAPTPTYDLVTHGDYPCHLGGLPLSPTVTTLVTHGDTNSNIIKKEKVIKEIVADAPTPTYEYPLTLGEPQDSEAPQESDSLKKPIEISEAPPIPAAPPKATRKARKGAEVPFPPAEYWEGITPSLVKWAIDSGVAESVASKWVAQKIDDMSDSAAAKGYRFIDWAAAFRKWYRKELPKEDGLEADLRKAAQHVFSTAKGNDGEKPVPSSVVWPAINKAIKALGGKEYLVGLANISEEWKDKKLTELKKFARDHLEGA